MLPARPSAAWRAAALLLAAAALLAGCQEAAPPAAAARPVRTVVAARELVDEPVVLTGQIQPREEASLAFRLGGRVVERLVDVGAAVRPGTVVARLDPRPQEDALRAAEAALAAAKAQLMQAQNTFERQSTLLGHGYTTRAQFDQAQQTLDSARSQVEAQGAQLRSAQDRLAWSELRADAAGAVTAKGTEPGEVVAAGQMVVKVAREAGRDAVFEVPAALIRAAPREIPVVLALTDDAKVQATGRVRELAPQANPVTRTFRVKVGLIDPPPGMRLGATVTGSVHLPSEPATVVPASALTRSEERPAVWVVAPGTRQVSLRPVAIARHEGARVVLASGVETGDVVVTAGVQALRPGQPVRLLGEPS